MFSTGQGDPANQGERKMEDRDIKMFGCTKDELHMMLDDCFGDYEMLAMGILSDAQEVMKQDPETARQFINKAKWVISQIKRNKMVA